MKTRIQISIVLYKNNTKDMQDNNKMIKDMLMI